MTLVYALFAPRRAQLAPPSSRCSRSDLAVPSLLFFLVAYAVANLAAFGVVIALRGRAARADYRGLAARHPWLTLALVVSLLSFIGIPPLAGFAAKLALFASAIDAGYGWLAVLAGVNSVVSLAYYGRVLGPAYFEAAGDPAGGDSAGNDAAGDAVNRWAAEPFPILGVWAVVGLAVCAALLVVLGIGADGLLHVFRTSRLLPI